MSMKLFKEGDRTKPTILFLHGAGVSSWMWTEQIEALKPDFYCLAVDLPGNGESAADEWVSFEETARRLADLIGAEAPHGKAHVVGLSLGGYTALTLQANHPERVETVVVSGVSARPFPNQMLMKPFFRLMSYALKWNLMIWLNMKMMQIPADVQDIYRLDSKRMSTEMLKRVYDEVLDFQLPPNLKAVGPTLLSVAGDKEVKLIKESLNDLAGVGEKSRAALIPNAHHGWNGEHPQLFTEMIRAWIVQGSLPAQLEMVRVGA